MRLLYHHWLSPFARTARLVLHEKGLEAEERLQPDWQPDDAFLALNPAGSVPVLVEENGLVLCDVMAISEYLEEVHPEPALLPGDAAARAEARRLVAWFDRKFQAEVSGPLVWEKLVKRAMGGDAPDSRVVRAGRAAIGFHMEYLSWLAEHRRCLAGDDLSLADFTAAAHLSLVDYAGDVPWDDFPYVKIWYARLKSRPSFRPLLREAIPGVPAPRHYADLDF